MYSTYKYIYFLTNDHPHKKPLKILEVLMLSNCALDGYSSKIEFHETKRKTEINEYKLQYSCVCIRWSCSDPGITYLNVAGTCNIQVVVTASHFGNWSCTVSPIVGRSRSWQLGSSKKNFHFKCTVSGSFDIA